VYGYICMFVRFIPNVEKDQASVVLQVIVAEVAEVLLFLLNRLVLQGVQSAGSDLASYT
jgi:hypothetical protein